MKLRLLKLSPAFLLIVILASCGKSSNTEGKMIPKNAAFVATINTKSLTEKANLKELVKEEWYQDMTKEFRSDSTVPEVFRNFTGDLSAIGVNTNENFNVFMEMTEAGETIIAFEGGVSDSKKFEDFILQASKKSVVDKDGDIHYLSSGDNNIITWNKDHFVGGVLQRKYSSYDDLFPRKGSNITADGSDLKAYCVKCYNLGSSDNLTREGTFTDLMHTEGDIHLWTSMENMMKGNMAMASMSMLKMEDLIKGYVNTYTANFEKGKLTFSMKSYLSKKIASAIKKSNDDFNADMIRYIPSQNVPFAFAGHFNPSSLQKIIELTGMDGLFNVMLKRSVGFTIDDIVKATRGDVMMAITDPVPDSDTTITDKKKRGGKVIFAISMNDKDVFNKIVRSFRELSRREDDSTIHYTSNKDFFVLSNDENMMNDWLKEQKHDQPFLDKIKGKPFGGYVDIHKLISISKPKPEDSALVKLWEVSEKMWDNAIFTGGDWNDGGINMKLEVNLFDKNMNSLEQMIRFAGTAVNAYKEKKKKEFSYDYNNLDKIEELKVDTAVKFTPPKIIRDEEIKMAPAKKKKH